MTTVATQEDRAKLILSIFKDHNVRAGEILMKGAVNKEFLLSGGHAGDYAGGLEFAVVRGWITTEPNMLRLTGAGFAAL
jgi:hypothetical protein